ncbi:MAG: ABC transporter ATP-binding protein [Clostridia bacterium]|nr:ABC transporter ATP-binding protein [Clostridia bacterium]
MNAVEIKNLSKSYKDVKAVDNLSLEIKKGELYSLLGVNGAGKTTTIKVLSLLTDKDEGEVKVLGFNTEKDTEEIKKLISLSPQETAVAPMLTVKENLEFISGICGFSKIETEKKVTELINLLSLQNVKSRRAGKLSGGYQRRLSIAMALISEPQLLFLDEPTLGLDVIARSELWDIIKALKGKITIILTTHYMEEAEELSDRIGIMKEGKLLISATPDEIKAKTDEATIEKAFIKIIKGEVK